MRKMSIVILLLVAVIMTACGTKETVDTDADTSVVEEVSVKDPVPTPEVSEPSEPVSTPEPAPVSDKIDSIVGVDIPTGGATDEINANCFPELRMYVTGNLVEQVSSGFTKYEVPNDTIQLQVIAGYTEDLCWETYQVPHYETADYGRYVVDVDYQENISYGSTFITVFDTQLGAGINIEIALGVTEAPTEEQQRYMKEYALANAEYIKQQVAAWSQDFVPDSGAEISSAAPVEVTTEDKVYALDAYPDITVTISYSSDGTVEILCESPSDATIQQKLVKTEDGKLQALDENGDMFLEITVNDEKIFVDTPYMEYANFFGDYTQK